MSNLHHGLIVLALAVWVSSAAAQDSVDYVEHDMFVADRGMMMDGSDGAIRRYTHTGQLLATLPAAGSGPIRGLAIARDGNLYAARGSDILRYVAPGYTPDATPFATGVNAQDIAISPTDQNVWCSFGRVPSEAQIREITPAGAVLQTISGGSLGHPRSLAFNFTGNRLYVADGGQEILVLDTSVSGAAVGPTQHANLAGFGATGILAEGIAVDPSNPNDTIFVSGDYAAEQDIVVVTGPSGATTVTSIIDYSTLPGFNAPAGLYVDSYGNLYAANRDRNSSQAPGIYCFFSTVGLLRVAHVGAEQISPIDVAFLPRVLELNIVSPDGVDANGVARVSIGNALTSVAININAPDFPGSVYALAMSLLPAATCNAGNPARPFGPGVLLGAPLGVSGQIDPRTVPLFEDVILDTSSTLIALGSSPLAPFPNCPGSQAGSVTFFSGLTDVNGQQTAHFVFPTAPCVAGLLQYVGIAVGVIDTVTQPILLGVLSSAPTCLRIEL